MQQGKQKNMLAFLKNENDYLSYLLEAFEIPETIEGKEALRKPRGNCFETIYQ